VLRIIILLDLQRKKVTRGWRKLGLHTDDLHDLNSPSDYCGDRIKENELDETCSTRGREVKNAYKILVGKHEVKRPLGRPRRRRAGY
jgi:hypothetical protein